MAPVRAVDVERTMPSVSLGSGRSRTTRCTRKGRCIEKALVSPDPLLNTFSYVELLEQQQAQLVHALQELYRRTLTGQGWAGSPLQDSPSGHPLTHDILERLGALRSDGGAEVDGFEEDVNVLHQRLTEGGSSFTQPQESTDSDSEQGQTPTTFFELPPLKPLFYHDPFSSTQLPPTPPVQSPYPPSDRSVLITPVNTSVPQTRRTRTDIRTSLNPMALQSQSWATPIIFEENTHLAQQFEAPTMCPRMSGAFTPQPMPMNTMGSRVAAAEWNEDDFSAFLNPTIIA